MKRVLVLNVDSFVGKEVCRRFYEAKEYLIDGTLYHQPSSEPKEERCEAADDSSDAHLSINATPLPTESSTLEVPPDLQPFLHSVMPRHGEISDEEFRVRVLTYDIIIAVLEDDAFEADCTIKVLRGTHYEVEKTFVLVSNVFTWTQTDAHEYELRRAARRAEREAARANRDEDEDDAEASEEEAEEEEEEEEPMERKVWSEEDYRQRYPDARYHVWRQLEHAVKHANSETLHTYVLWSGLPYGGGEDLLAPYFHSAWNHQTILQYGDGSNCIPTIHVHDLSRIIYLVGSSYDTLEDRYMFAVDRGNNTQAEILQGIRDFIGGVVEMKTPEIDRTNQVKIPPRESESALKKMSRVLLETAEDIESQKGYEAMSALVENVKMAHGETSKEMLLLANLAERELTLQANLDQRDERGDDKNDPNRANTPGRGETTCQEGLIVAPPHGLANWFSAVDVRCVPGAVFSLLEETEWVSPEGFFANVDKLVLEFKNKRQLQPVRLVLSGPPCTMRETVACKLSEIFSIPHLTLANVTSAYEAHVAAIRAEMVDILVRRRLRCHEARERQRLKEEREMRERAKADGAEDEEEDEEEGDEEGEDEDDDETGAEEEEEGEEREGDEEEEDEEDEERKPDLSLEERIRQTITEAKLLQLSGNDEEEEEEEYNDEDEEMDEKAAALKQKVDEAERYRIATLREEYRFASRLLTLRLVNGEFPAQPTTPDEEAEEETEEEDDVVKKREDKKKDAEALISDEAPPTIRYLDEAIAVMMRWRLRQDDCRSQGYILESFPETVRQASLMFMADTDEQKEMQRPKLEQVRNEETNPQPPPDANFPLPELNELDDVKKQEILDAMTGKTFLSAEEALVPTHETFFPDSFIFLTASEALIRAHMSAAGTRAKTGGVPLDFHEQFTQFMTHHNPDGPPTESLVCWFQTVVVEKVNNAAAENDAAEGAVAGESVPRKAYVFFLPALATSPAFMLQEKELATEETQLNAYCNFIRWTVLKNIGFGSCGLVIDEIRKDEEEHARNWMEVRSEWMVLEKLRAAEELFTAAEKKLEAAGLEEERRVLRFYETREASTSVAGVDSVPVDVYLMRYVLPSLTPLMAEVVRMRPEDPVTVLADALFHYKRQVTL